MLRIMKRKLTATTCLISFISPVFAFSADRDSQSSLVLAEPGMASNLIQTTLGLIVILGVIAGAAWLAKRYGNLKVGAQGRIKIIGGISLGGRGRVVLLEVGAQQLLIGVTPGNIQTLYKLDEAIIEEPKRTDMSGFAHKLRSAIGNGK